MDTVDGWLHLSTFEQLQVEISLYLDSLPRVLRMFPSPQAKHASLGRACIPSLVLKRKKIKFSAVGILSKYSTTDLNLSLGRKGRDSGSFQLQD